MHFKMSGKDFELLAKFIEKKAKGTDLKIKSHNDARLDIDVILTTGEVATLSFFTEEINSFPKILKSGNLGDEIWVNIKVKLNLLMN